MNIPNEKLNSTKLAFIINECMEALDKSKVGSLYYKNEDGTMFKQDGRFLVSNIAALGVLTTLLMQVVPKEFSAKIDE